MAADRPPAPGKGTPDPLIRKLERSGAGLTDADRAKLRDAAARTRRVGPRQDLIQEGERPEDVLLVLEGFACRHKTMPDGKRQIMALLVPGDFCDLHVAILGAMDHGIATLSPCTVAAIPRATVEDLTANHPRINRALWWATLVDEGTLREWLVSMGQRPADRQLAHLLCELRVRLDTVGLAPGGSYELPLTQEELGDALGLSPVHVNRVLQQLRGDGLVATRGKTLAVVDVARLEAFAGFDPNYLHLEPRAEEGGAAGRVSVTPPAAGRPSADRPRGLALPDAGA